MIEVNIYKLNLMDTAKKKFRKIIGKPIWTFTATLLIGNLLSVVILLGLIATNLIDMPAQITFTQEFSELPQNDEDTKIWINKQPQITNIEITRPAPNTVEIKYLSTGPLKNQKLKIPFDELGYKKGLSPRLSFRPEMKSFTSIILTLSMICLQIPLLFMGLRNIRKSRNEGFNHPKIFAGLNFRSILLGIGTGLGFIIIKIAYGILLQIVMPNATLSSQAIFQNMASMNPATKIIIIVFVGITAPLVEEIFFRGYAFATIAEKTGKFWPAAIVSSLLFAASHLDIVTFPLFFTMGLVLAKLYQKNKSLIPGIAMHMTNNLIAFAGLLLLAG